MGFLAVGAGSLLACASASSEPRPAVAPSVPPGETTTLSRRPDVDALRAEGVRFARIPLKRFALALDLPDPDGWRPAHGRSRFVELVHEATGSRLVLRRWLLADRATAETCEADARLFREFPKGGVLLSEARREIAGVDAHSRVGVVTKAEVVRGYVTAFGGRGRDCVAFGFTTEATGQDPRRELDAVRSATAQRVVEERVAVLEQRTLSSLRAVDTIDTLGREEP